LSLLLAQATSDNAPGGAYFSLWFPLGLFIIVGAILWLLYTRPHNRVPPRRAAHARAGAGGGQSVGTATGWGHDGPPESGAAAPGTKPAGQGDDDEGRIV
jgi:hypothetical protein